MSKRKGKVVLVGAGPGDPELMTIKAWKALKSAQVVITDELISSDMTAALKEEIKVPIKERGKASQDEVNQMTLEELSNGLNVVRLKSGDPFVYGRGAEEIIFFRSHGFEVEVIPGISSALVAPSVAGIPVTHRGVADQFLVCTGHGKDGTYPDIPQYQPNRTVLFLMGVGRLPDIVQQLKTKGFPSDCPSAVIQSATISSQKVVSGTVSDIAQIVQQAKITSPAVIVFGNVVHVLQDPSSTNAVLSSLTNPVASIQPNEANPIQ